MRDITARTSRLSRARDAPVDVDPLARRLDLLAPSHPRACLRPARARARARPRRLDPTPREGAHAARILPSLALAARRRIPSWPHFATRARPDRCARSRSPPPPRRRPRRAAVTYVKPHWSLVSEWSPASDRAAAAAHSAAMLFPGARGQPTDETVRVLLNARARRCKKTRRHVDYTRALAFARFRSRVVVALLARAPTPRARDRPPAGRGKSFERSGARGDT